MSRAQLARAALRVALGAAFLSAVASRLGLWGSHAGHLGDAFAAFVSYVAELNPWLPAAVWPVLAVLVTAVEGSLGLALVLGVARRPAAIAAGALLAVFALAMSLFTGPKSALDYSVWTAAAGAFVLALETDAVVVERTAGRERPTAGAATSTSPAPSTTRPVVKVASEGA